MDAETVAFIREYGLPCVGYMKKITGMFGVYGFLRNLILTYRGIGLSDDEIKEKCIAQGNVLFASGVFEVGDSDLGKLMEIVSPSTMSGSEWVQSILSIKSAEYKGCRHYYSNYDDSHSICSICPLSKSFQNSTLESECTVIQYALLSKDNTEYVEKSVSLPNFKALYDLAANVQGKTKPVFFDLTWILLGHIIRKKDELPYEDKESLTVMLASLILKDMRTVSSHAHSPALTRTLVGTSKQAVEYVMSYPTKLSIDAAIAELESPAASELKTDGIVYAEHSNLGKKTIEEYYDTPGESREPEPEHVLEIDMNFIIGQIYNDEALPVSSEPVEAPFIDKNNPPSTTPLPSSIGPVSTEEGSLETHTAVPPVIEESHMHEADEPGDEMEDTASDISEPEDTEDEDVAFSDTENEAGPNADSPIMQIVEVPLASQDFYPWEGSMVVIPSVTVEELHTFAINLDAGDARLLSIISNNLFSTSGHGGGVNLSIEFVSLGEGRFAYLLYIPKFNSYFYTTFGNSDVKYIIGRAMSYASIKKFCYQPFVLIAQLRKEGIDVKSIYSLFSVSEVMYPSHHMSMEIALETLGAFPFSCSKGTPKSNIIRYMHCYHRIFMMRHKEIISNGSERMYSESSLFSQALSYSFLFPSTNGDGCLFYMPAAGNYHFLASTKFQFGNDKKLFCISFDFSPIASSYVIKRLITTLYETGVFRVADASLVCLGVNFLTYAVEQTKDRWFDGKVHSTLLKILMAEKTRGIEYRKIVIREGDPLSPCYTE